MIVEQSERVDSVESADDGPIKIKGWKLDLARRAAGLSQAELAKRAGVSASHISRLINGHGGVSQDVMGDILAVFDDRITYNELRADGPGE